MDRIVILGAGKFGQRAARRLRAGHPDADIRVVDHRQSALRAVEGLGVETALGEGGPYLMDFASEANRSAWVVPAIPVHVAYEWMRVRLAPEHRVLPLAVPEPVSARLPNPIRGKGGELFASVADFICPEDCPEPETICTSTGKPRPLVLHAHLASLRFDRFRSVVVVSRQMAPGVGGYPVRSLYSALHEVVSAKTPVLLSTACKCHGVVHAFDLERIT